MYLKHKNTQKNKIQPSSIFFSSAPFEVQLVHYNPKFDSYEQAVKFESGVAILAVRFELSQPRSPNPGLALFDKILRILYTPGSRIELDSRIPGRTPNLAQMLFGGKNEEVVRAGTSEYFSYHGSLTRPPCLNTVTWIVLANPSRISSKQV